MAINPFLKSLYISERIHSLARRDSGSSQQIPSFRPMELLALGESFECGCSAPTQCSCPPITQANEYCSGNTYAVIGVLDSNQ
uniref:Phlebovirus glycoprotein G2 fusion domain-containing protein n=1 Tax=Globodera pallida TaxID=36090 RepID=A0A183CPL9_GLOPA